MAAAGVAGLVTLAWLGLAIPLAVLVAAMAGWLLVSAVASGLVAWRLSAVLARPGDTLLAIKRIEGDASPVNRAALASAYRGLDDLLVRAAHEKNGRISELARAREVARAEGENRADFLAGMSHELRTPLNAIIGYAMLLAEDAADAGQAATARDLDKILQSSRHLLRLINDLLDLSRLNAGEVAVERSVVDVAALVDAAVAEAAGDALRAGLDVRAAVTPAARVMVGDGPRLRQCLSALLASLLATLRDQVVTVQVALSAADETRIEFRFAGHQGDLARTASEAPSPDLIPSPAMDSSVLTMTVVGRLAALMGGALTDGDGAVVLSLPRNAPSADLAESDPVATDVSRPSGLVPRTVLVIDDDASTTDLLGRWLGAQGYRVMSAPDGLRGLDLARSETPDFVILDIFMPGQSGYEVLAQMKADPVLRTIPVIIASSDDNRRLGLEAGAAEVLVKPLSRQRLRSVLDVLGEQVRGDLLVVDDDEDVREIVGRYAVQAGLTVRLAADGAEGLALARAHPPGAIILDLCMPGTDGFAMIEALATDPALSGVPVMVLSQMDIGVREHVRLQKAGHVFHPKWKSSPIEVVENIKTMVAR